MKHLPFVLIALTGLSTHVRAGGTWVPLDNRPPLMLGHVLVLSDGTVLGFGFDVFGAGATNTCYRLTPDVHGSYLHGAWSTVASMNYTRLYFSSAVLRDGRVFVAGGEYGTGAATAEIYNPSNDTWTIINPPTSVLNASQNSPTTGRAQAILDAECKVLPDGNLLDIPISPQTADGTIIYNPGANSWSAGAPTLRWVAESGAVKLPDGSLITIDPDTTYSERYLPSTNAWQNEPPVPVALFASLAGYVGETGPGVLLPNGRAIFFGGTGHTALYTPSGNNNQGSWLPGPNFPGGLVSADAPGAMMVNGNVLVAAAPPPYIGSDGIPVFPGPTTFFEYDYSVGSTGGFTQVNAPGGATFPDGSYTTMLLDLPDGTVLFAYLGSNQLWVYQPGGTPLAAGKPAIASITQNGDSLHLTGTLFNGISEGATYGDDHQMSSDFPLVRFTDTHGNVRYGRTSNWSSTGLMTGNSVVSTDCTMPSGASVGDTIQVVANGIASDGVSLVVSRTTDAGPGSLRQVAAFLPAGSTVSFDPSLSGQIITLTSGEILLNNNLTIDASALANGIQINAGHNSRIFEVAGGVTVTLNSLALANGYAGPGATGGAIVNGGTLVLNNCTLSGNSVDSGVAGGAILNSGPLTMTGCTLSGNSGGFAGAINNFSTCVLQNCTFAGNSCVYNGGAIDNVAGTLSLLHCTFSGNSAGGAGAGIDNYLGQLNITNTIIAANNGLDVYNWPGSTVTAGGANIAQTLVSAGTLIGSDSLMVADPLLGPLANNGGSTLTMLPQTGSPAVDAGVTAVAAGLTYDQRGSAYPRVVGDAVDIGAVEAAIIPLVFKNSDSGYGSLRYAINYAANNPVITFAPDLSGQTVLVTNGEMAVNNNLTIDASALANGIQINANHNSRIFNVAGSVVVTLNSLSLSNGYAGAGNWGGAIVNSGSLTLNNCTVAGNSVDANAVGGAIENDGSLTLAGCTFSGNSGGYAGAIDNRSTCTAQNCTFSGNLASVGNGGAIDSAYSATLSLLQCTLSGNAAAGAGAGIDNYLSQLNITNSIIAVNNGLDVYSWPGSTVAAGGSNIVQLLGSGGSLIGSDSIIAADPLLGPLANNGGPTLTMLPQAGSPAIDAGVTSASAGLIYDQRGLGFPRVFGSAVDIGAVEAHVIVASQPPLLTGAAHLGNGAFGFTFTSSPGASFTVFSSSNLDLAVSAWSNLGPAVEIPAGSGQFQFTDLQATNNPQQYYRVRSP